jgi:hypothetical protein
MKVKLNVLVAALALAGAASVALACGGWQSPSGKCYNNGSECSAADTLADCTSCCNHFFVPGPKRTNCTNGCPNNA